MPSVFNETILIFLDQICSKKINPVQNRKSEHHHRIQHIQISVNTKFHLKQTTFPFLAKIAQKVYKKSQRYKGNIV